MVSIVANISAGGNGTTACTCGLVALKKKRFLRGTVSMEMVGG
jgi:tetraacyldisaccharide-1-P 4'-kinase